MAKTSVLDRIRELDAEKKKLLEEAKATALANAQQAIADLNELGYNYRLVEGSESRSSSTRQASGRRSGIRNDVLRVVSNAGPDGITPASIREKLGVEGKSGAQSVANALSALKRTNKIADKNGAYVAA